MRKVKDLKSVLSQQGVDLPESCADEASAMRKIAEAERLGSIEIEGSATIEEAKAAHDEAVKAVNAVRALNIPIWYVTREGVPKTLNAHDGQSHTLDKVTTAIVVDCAQITGVPGKTSMRIPQASYDDGSPAPLAKRQLSRPSEDGFDTWHVATVELAAGETKPVTIKFRGRNLCGDSVLTLRLEP